MLICFKYAEYVWFGWATLCLYLLLSELTAGRVDDVLPFLLLLAFFVTFGIISRHARKSAEFKERYPGFKQRLPDWRS